MISCEISRRTFTPEDLLRFAELSGDWNPIHVDPVAARRLLAGEVVVHGMLVLLWALDAYCGSGGAVPSVVNVCFHSPTVPGKPVVLRRETSPEWADDKINLLVCLGDTVLATIHGQGVCPQANEGIPGEGCPPRQMPADLSFADLKGRSDAIRLQAAAGEVERYYPGLAAALGVLPVVSVMAASLLVGMHCPGLHSLFSSAELTFVPESRDAVLQWSVVRHTIAQAPVRLDIRGGGLAGKLEAFVRPEPVAQPTMSYVAERIAGGECHGQVAWVIGGGRGLGELTAKLVAAGGGQVMITYHRGMDDALRVADEITLWGGSCDVMPLDIRKSFLFERVPSGVRHPTQVYYFASSRIGRPGKAEFDADLYAEFSELYVHAFSRLAFSLGRVVQSRLKIFYPSTVFIDELPRDFPEYIAAKAAGEALCGYLTRHVKTLDILVRRLPRLLTDQTTGLIRRTMADPLVQLKAVVTAMCLSGEMEDQFDQ